MVNLQHIGATQAITDLGLEKSAFIGGLISRPLAWLGRGIVGAVGRAGAPRLAQGLGTLGKGMAENAASFGLFGGGLGALTAEEGERGKGFLKGLGSGVLGGLGWGLGKNVGSQLLQKGLGQQGYSALQQAMGPATVGQRWNPFSNKPLEAKQRWFSGFKQGFGPGMKQFGAHLTYKGVPFASALALSSMAPTFESASGAPQTMGSAAYNQAQGPHYLGYGY